MMKKQAKSGAAALLSAFLLASAAWAQSSPPPSQSLPISSSSIDFADLADLALAARIAAVVTVHDATKLKGPDAIGVAAGWQRFYVEGDVDALIAGPGGLPARVSWLVDLPDTPANRASRLRKRRLILLARPVAGQPGTLQLVARGAAPDWSPALETRLRGILTEANGAGAPPVVTGIGHAFHVAGSIPGEGETQIFLKTADGRPVSLSVQRHPGEDPRYTVSLGEIVDDTAAPPQRDTLLWYRLACALPSALPDDSLADQGPDDATQARADYRFVLDQLGACGRTTGAR